MEEELLTIAKVAELAKVSKQSIYKRVNNTLSNYIKLIDNQKMIDIRALQEVYGVEVEQPIQPILQATIESLTKELERKSEELQSKDKQYADLKASMEEQLKSKDRQIEHYGKLLDQAQMLNAMNKKKIEALENKLEEPNEISKGFWAKIFKK